MSLSEGARARLDRLRPQGIRLGLERPRRLLAALGNPHLRVPTVLIAGTNGKGSTAALVEAMARAAGYSTGLFTSPGLESDEEQIRLGGETVTTERFAELLDAVLPAARRTLGGDPTVFEALTAAAFLAFDKAGVGKPGVELALVECGMGGARDATNVADPQISLLTSVGLEHRRFLGETVEAIAREKAGIFRPGRPAVVGRLGPGTEAVRDVLRSEAAAVGAELHLVDDEVAVSISTAPRPGFAQRVELVTSERTCWERSYSLDLALAGEHQAWNLALAVRAAELLAARGWGRIDAGAIAHGAAACRVPGRLETIELAGATGGVRILLDVAHNPQAVEALVRHLDADLDTDIDAGGAPGRRWDLLFGVLEDKQVEAMLPPLASRARRVVLTRPSDPRGRDPEELRRWLPAGVEATVEPDPAAALALALAGTREGAGGGDGVGLVVCGSMVLVGELRRRLRSGSQPSGS